MPPVKKNNLNTIFQYKNIAKAIEAETIAEKENNSIENTNNKSLDTYFGITEKPPSPIPESIYNFEKELENLKSEREKKIAICVDLEHEKTRLVMRIVETYGEGDLDLNSGKYLIK